MTDIRHGTLYAVQLGCGCTPCCDKRSKRRNVRIPADLAYIRLMPLVAELGAMCA